MQGLGRGPWGQPTVLPHTPRCSPRARRGFLGGDGARATGSGRWWGCFTLQVPASLTTGRAETRRSTKISRAV